MRVSHWSWLGGTRRGRDTVPSQSPPRLEQLEPRLLLSADPTASLMEDFQPVDTQARQAISVELENGNWASGQETSGSISGLELDDAAGPDSADSRSYVGELLDTIDDLGLANDTIFIFTADNGPEALSAGETSITVETAIHGSAGPWRYP